MRLNPYLISVSNARLAKLRGDIIPAGHASCRLGECSEVLVFHRHSCRYRMTGVFCRLILFVAWVGDAVCLFTRAMEDGGIQRDAVMGCRREFFNATIVTGGGNPGTQDRQGRNLW